MKIRWIRFAVLGLLSAIVVACTSSVTTSHPSTTAIKICASGSSVSGTASLWYTYEKQLFQKYGLEATLIDSKSGSDAATALITKAVDICQMGIPAAVNAVVAGEDLVTISSITNTYLYSLVVTPEIKTPQDLKGKALAISEPGGSSDFAIRSLLAKYNIQPKDVTLLSIGGQGERLAAMETGQVAGTLISVPGTVEAQEKGYKILLDMYNSGIPYAHNGLVTRREYIKEHREIVLNVMKAVGEGIAQMKQDKPGTLAVLAKYLKLDLQQDAPSLNEAYDVFVQKYLVELPYPSIAGIQTILTQTKAENPQAAQITPEDVIDNSIVQELEVNGFFKDLYPSQ